MTDGKSKRTVKDESDDEDVKQKPDVKDEDAEQQEVVKKDEDAEQQKVVKKDEDVDEPVEEAEEPHEEPPSKKRKVRGNVDPDDEEVETFMNENGEHYIELSNKRRATVREFKGSTLIDLREYYTDKAGDEKPGSKGMSLTAEQWQTLKAAIPQIDAWIAAGAGTKKSESSGSKSTRGKGRSKRA